MREIRVPKNSRENRELKQGHVEDDNVDIAYFNFPIVWPNIFFIVMSAVFITAGYFWSMRTDYRPTEEELAGNGGYVRHYGHHHYVCKAGRGHVNETDLPSLIQLFELNVPGNILLRLAVCYPMAIRIFNFFGFQNSIEKRNKTLGLIPRVFLRVLPVLTILEVFACALFCIITGHTDSTELNHRLKALFAITSSLNIFLCAVSAVANQQKSDTRTETIVVGTKVACATIYCYCMQFYSSDPARTWNICSSYLPRETALREYYMIASYYIFYATIVYDLRHVRFLCYPRSCSGECEPVKPENFQPGAKYEHCRAFEYNQLKTLDRS